VFDMTFDAVMGFHQAGFLLGGGLVALVGAAILLHVLHSFLRAARVPALITGVRRDGRMFYPVYRYMMPDGAVFETVSDTGSSLVRGKETGRAVTLYVFPEDPLDIRSDLQGAVLVGLVFLLPGLFLLGHGILSFPFTPMTGVAAAVFLLVAAQRLRRAVVPHETRGTKDDWRAAMRRRRRERFEKMELTTIEAYMQTPEGLRAAAEAEQGWRMAAPVLLLLGCAALWGAWHTAGNMRDLMLHGQRAQGVVERFETHRSDGTTMYRARVSFSDVRGDRHSFTEKTAASHPVRRVGDAVDVLYLPEDPAAAAQVDAGMWGNAFWPFVLGLSGAGLLAAALSLWRAQRAAREDR
jgi:hypothetical protein